MAGELRRETTAGNNHLLLGKNLNKNKIKTINQRHALIVEKKVTWVENVQIQKKVGQGSKMQKKSRRE